MKDYYNTIVCPEEEGGNPESHYLADDVNHGITAPGGKEYESDAIERIYRYGSVSEHRQTLSSMDGMQTAYDGKYASMLVPWSVTEPVNEERDTIQNPDGSSGGMGYGYRKFRNTFYRSRLRIEKLDSETGENILHDGAVFTIYAADREDGENTDGLARFYETDTQIKGSREFLEAMGASEITRAARGFQNRAVCGQELWRLELPYAVSASRLSWWMPKAAEQGNLRRIRQHGTVFRREEENPAELSWQDQNTGYLMTRSHWEQVPMFYVR